MEITHIEHQCSHPCREQTQSTDPSFKHSIPGGRRLWKQMLIGFICAACLGVIMLILGSVFIQNAIKGNTSITLMLCVLGMGKFCFVDGKVLRSHLKLLHYLS